MPGSWTRWVGSRLTHRWCWMLQAEVCKRRKGHVCNGKGWTMSWNWLGQRTLLSLLRKGYFNHPFTSQRATLSRKVMAIIGLSVVAVEHWHISVSHQTHCLFGPARSARKDGGGCYLNLLSLLARGYAWFHNLLGWVWGMERGLGPSSKGYIILNSHSHGTGTCFPSSIRLRSALMSSWHNDNLTLPCKLECLQVEKETHLWASHSCYLGTDKDKFRSSEVEERIELLGLLQPRWAL